MDLDSRIQDELERTLLLPSGDRADWNDVVRRAGVRSSRRAIGPRRLALMVAIVALLGAVGTAVGLGFDFMAEQDRVDRQPWAAPEMKPAGDRVEVARGPHWSFMAWKAEEGVCVAYAAGAATQWARACGHHPSADDDPVSSNYLITTLQTPGDGGAMSGAVTGDVARVELQLADGRVLSAPAEAAPAALGPDVRLFLIRTTLDPAIGPIRAYVSYGADGTVLERFATGWRD